MFKYAIQAFEYVLENIEKFYSKENRSEAIDLIKEILFCIERLKEIMN